MDELAETGRLVASTGSPLRGPLRKRRHRDPEQEADGHQGTVQHLHFAVLCNEMKGKRFEVKGRAGRKRARGLVTAALTRRR